MIVFLSLRGMVLLMTRTVRPGFHIGFENCMSKNELGFQNCRPDSSWRLILSAIGHRFVSTHAILVWGFGSRLRTLERLD